MDSLDTRQVSAKARVVMYTGVLSFNQALLFLWLLRWLSIGLVSVISSILSGSSLLPFGPCRPQVIFFDDILWDA